MKTRQVCRYVHIPIQADGGDTYECHDIQEPQVVSFSEAARVTSTSVLQVRDLKMEMERVASLPSEPLLYRQVYKNCADGTTLTNSVTPSVTGTEGYEVTKTEGVSTTIGPEARNPLTVTSSVQPFSHLSQIS